MSRRALLVILRLLLQVTATYCQTRQRVNETDKPLPPEVIAKLKEGKPMLEMLEFSASHKVSKDYLVVGKDFIYIEFIFGNPDARLKYKNKGLQVRVSTKDASDLIICIKSYDRCGSKYADTHGMPCNCKNVSTSHYSAVRVKGHWYLNKKAAYGSYVITWEEAVDVLFPDKIPESISISRQLPNIISSSSTVSPLFLHVVMAVYVVNCWSHHNLI